MRQARLKMQFKVRMRLSHFDPVGPLDKIGEEETRHPPTPPVHTFY